MTITTKYNVGDVLFFESPNRKGIVLEACVMLIIVYATVENSILIRYGMGNPAYGNAITWEPILEKDLFTSKEELQNHLNNLNR